MYEEFYTNQIGNGKPVFAGGRHQHGYGLECVLERLFRHTILSLFKSNDEMMASKAIKTGMRVADDVAQSTSFKESAQKMYAGRYKSYRRKAKLVDGFRYAKQ